jgi:hypothetical protein
VSVLPALVVRGGVWVAATAGRVAGALVSLLGVTGDTSFFSVLRAAAG